MGSSFLRVGGPEFGGAVLEPPQIGGHGVERVVVVDAGVVGADPDHIDGFLQVGGGLIQGLGSDERGACGDRPRRTKPAPCSAIQSFLLIPGGGVTSRMASFAASSASAGRLMMCLLSGRGGSPAFGHDLPGLVRIVEVPEEEDTGDVIAEGAGVLDACVVAARLEDLSPSASR